MGWQDDKVVSPAPGTSAPWMQDKVVGPPAAAAPERPAGEQAARIVGQGAQGVNDSIANTIGAPVDLAAAGLRRIGINADKPIGGSESLKSGIDYVATLPQRLGDALSQGSLSPITETRTSRFEPENRAEKIAKGTGEGVGAVLSTMLPAAAIANTARAGTVTQGVAQTLASQPITQLASGAVGGATTGATDSPLAGLAASLTTPIAMAAGSRLISPVTNQLSAQERNLVQAAQREGIALTPAQQTGSPGLQVLEETMTRVPLASGPMRGAFDTQRGQFNAAVNQRAGITAKDANPETLTRAFQQQGKTFDDLAARTIVQLDDTAVQKAKEVAQDYGRRLNTDVAPVFQSYMDDLAPYLKDGAQIPGDLYARMRTGITETIRENQNNPTLQKALGGLVETLDGAVERSTKGALRGEWQDARRQYQALMTVDKAMRGGTQEARAAGDIPFSALTNAVRGGDRVGYARGRGQLNELSRIGDYLAPKIPNSGTPERGLAANLLTGGAIFGGGMATGVGAPAAAAATAIPWTVSRLYNSPLGQAYLTNQLAGRVSVPTALAQQGVQQSLQGSQDGQIAALARALLQSNERRVPTR